MKVFERVIEQKMREMVDKDASQIGFMSSKDTMDPIFIAHQLQESAKCRRSCRSKYNIPCKIRLEKN